jgi:hypothetical protein
MGASGRRGVGENNLLYFSIFSISQAPTLPRSPVSTFALGTIYGNEMLFWNIRTEVTGIGKYQQQI